MRCPGIVFDGSHGPRREVGGWDVQPARSLSLEVLPHRLKKGEGSN